MCKGGPCDPNWLRGLGMEQTANAIDMELAEVEVMAAEHEEPVRTERVAYPRNVDELHALMLSQPITLHIPIPEGYTVDEASAFKRMIREALEPVVRDAMMDIDSKRVAQ